MAAVTPPRDRNGFEIAIVCALKLERDAVEAMLEVDFKDQGRTYGKAGQDRNAYTTGVLGGKPVVLAYPRDIGSLNAATVASDMRYSFKTIKIALVVGVVGGAPRTPDRVDILLGDVIISTAVIQYDFGKQYPDGFQRKRGVENTLGRVDAEVANFLALLDGHRATKRLTVRMNEYSQDLTFSSTRPHLDDDYLFPPTYRHKHQDPQTCKICSACMEWDDAVCDEAEKSSCDELGCDKSSVMRRGINSRQQTPRHTSQPQEVRLAKIHFGRVASANSVLKSGLHRDKLAGSEEVIGFEMEGAGTWDQFPTVVVKGVCDYADSHKNKVWQGHAAATAASCAKAILQEWEISDQAPANAELRSTERPTTPRIYLPFNKNRRFIGRLPELEALDRKLFVEQDCQNVAVVGLGGIGKTQVVLSLAYSVKEKHPDLSIFWVPAVSNETFEQAFEKIARLLGIHPDPDGIDDIKELVRRCLSTSTVCKWLLVVDNADDADLLYGSGWDKGMLRYLPHSDLGLTVFTTRDRSIAQSLVGSDVIEVERMERKEAVEMFKKSLVREEDTSNELAVSALLEELDNLPLAIIQAAAYINVNRISIAEYVVLLTSTEKDMVYIMSSEMRDSTRYEQAASAVATTWIVSFKQILKRDVVAADLLQFISCIEWKAVPHSILPALQLKARTMSALGMLQSYSFLAKRHEGKYDMHRLVHLAARIWIDHYDRTAEVQARAMQHLARVFPSDEYTNRDIWQEYLPHVARIDRDTASRDVEGQAELCLKVGRCLLVDGKTKDAVFWLKESSKRRRIFADDDVDRLASHHALAGAYLANGQVEKAVEMLEYVVRVKEKLPEDHPSRLTSQHALVSAYVACGRTKDALQLSEHISAIEECNSDDGTTE